MIRWTAADVHVRNVEGWLAEFGYETWRAGIEFPRCWRPLLFERLGDFCRWWPDFGARGPAGLLWVDAKADTLDSANYAIELAALNCYQMIELRLRHAVVVAFPNRVGNYVHDLEPTRVESNPRANGSGTAYALFRKDAQRPLVEILGGGQ